MPSIKLSVNVNKVATLRNSRGGNEPDVLQAVGVCVAAGAAGITVHPRADERHIRKSDVYAVAEQLYGTPDVEFNIEGDPRPEFLELVLKVRPTQCTLVPVKPGEITSQAGWPPTTRIDELKAIVCSVKKIGVRVSMFIDPVAEAVKWAAAVGGDRVELYTEPFARAFEAGRGESSFATYAEAAALAHSVGLGINAGHDLNLKNLTVFRKLPHLQEVSIGHALMSHALYVGLERAVRDYRDALTATT
jgi:pyridoxine 5-phosphate synthase